ncbi:TIGR01777 family protein [Desulfuribacillus stibiiarsenatis]|uniref:TIGR01777 family protein n=1 Tax=Desulfuribacillus stibiiarsenatis TaxID=1390249 RepID=A0A1E5L3A2_9FIRM|nr:TIGR01777 family oxidoreductase [Desulfuribacillus stibiiarsenatis]OEH84543.1 TIGR01777 family protein [Desulfuribacillus stibiiarsenatis]
MHVLISGGTGFIGKHLVEELLLHRYQVTVLTRNSNKITLGASNHNMQKGYRVVDWKYLAENQEFAQTVDCIVNLSGETINGRWTKAKKTRILESRVSTTQKIIDAIATGRVTPKLLINGSAIGIYGDRDDEKVTEESQLGYGFLSEICKTWEQLACKAQAYNVRVVLLRTGVVLGKNGGALEKLVLPYRLHVGGTLGNGSQWSSWIHLKDLVGLIRFAIENDQLQGPLNGTSPNPVTMHSFGRMIGKTIKTHSLFQVPGLLLRVILGEMADLILHSQRVIPKKAIEQGYVFQYPELETALQNILIDTPSS